MSRRPKRARSGPSIKNEVRMDRTTSGSGVVWSRSVQSMASAAPRHSTRAPNARRSWIFVSVSETRGTLWRIVSPSHITTADKIARPAFLLPAISTVPCNGLPPERISSLIGSPRPWEPPRRSAPLVYRRARGRSVGESCDFGEI